MKILHTADWHLGNQFHGHSRLEEHGHFFEWMLRTLVDEKPDALIVAGDIFDNSNPSAKAESLFYEFLDKAATAVDGLQIVVTAGNHDSGGRIDAPASVLRQRRIFLFGTVKRDGDNNIMYGKGILPLRDIRTEEVKALCLAVPYLRTPDYPTAESPVEGMRSFFAEMMAEVRAHKYGKLPKIAVAHFYASGTDISPDEKSRYVVGGQEAVDVSVLGNGLSYMALGHIHKAMRVGGGSNAYYSGSPLPMSFNEIDYRHGINRVEIDDSGVASVSRIAYEPPRKLISIPEKGAATVEQAFKAIEKLPEADKLRDSVGNWPYLEIRIAETQPEPTLAREIVEVLSGKAVRFCRVLRVQQRTPKVEESNVNSLSSLREAAPIDMLKEIYANKYGTELPDTLETLFREAESAAEAEHNAYY